MNSQNNGSRALTTVVYKKIKQIDTHDAIRESGKNQEEIEMYSMFIIHSLFCTDLLRQVCYIVCWIMQCNVDGLRRLLIYTTNSSGH